MPELPEVQTVVNDLNKKVVGRTIVDVWCDTPGLIKDPFGNLKTSIIDQRKKNLPANHVGTFRRSIKGSKILGATRKGKNILIALSGDKMLLVHQKMTGHFLLGKWQIKKGKAVPLEPKSAVEDPYNRFVHLIFYLDNGKMLALSDLRKFAKVILGTRGQIEDLPELKQLGPDALGAELTFDMFKEIISVKGKTIKQILMEPNVIAGIGNIYSDDILYVAKVHPRQAPRKLNKDELKSIYTATRAILERAVNLRGTSTSDFRDLAGKEGGYTEYRLVYQRENHPCQRCKTPIKRIKVGSRSAHYCPKCQRAVRLYYGQEKQKT